MNTTDNYMEKWKATLEEYNAKADRLDAGERLRHDEWMNNMQSQFDAMGDWTEATWDEFTAKAEKQWHEMVIGLSSKDDSDDDSNV